MNKKNSFLANVLLSMLACACTNDKKQKNDGLIKDCPEEKIANKMPTITDNSNGKELNEYYIYKGQRKEINDFDNEWIKRNCNVKITEVH